VVVRDAVRAESWTVDGIAKVTGAMDVGETRIDGSLTVGGLLSGERVTLKGTLDAGGAIEVTGSFETNGTTRIVGRLRADRVRLEGASRVGGSIEASTLVRVRGTFVGSDVTAGSFVGDGKLELGGTLAAADVEVTFRAASHVGTIRASRVRLALVAPNPVELVLGRQILVQVDRIEADEVDLEGVDVAFVRSPRIRLGRDAHVSGYEGVIEKQHPSARVGPESRSPRPHGLHR
jgi:cytoskeletal protein CcmA (bactofilin family)